MYLFNLEVQVAPTPEPKAEELTYTAPSEEGAPEVVQEKKENKGGHTPGSSFFKS
jgi:hypothetical protein